MDLGWIGASLIVLILFSGYRRSIKAFRFDPELASLMVAYVATSTFYSVTEAGFRMLTPSWIFLLLAVVSAGGIAAGLLGGETPKIIASCGGIPSRTPVGDKLNPERQAVYTARRGRTQREFANANDRR